MTNGFAGYVYLGLQRWLEARTALQSALAAEPPGGKQRSVYLADVATTYLRDGHLDEACRLAGEALDAAVGSGYATGLRRVRVLHQEATAWHPAPAVKNLTDRLHAVGG